MTPPKIACFRLSICYLLFRTVVTYFSYLDHSLRVPFGLHELTKPPTGTLRPSRHLRLS